MTHTNLKMTHTNLNLKSVYNMDCSIKENVEKQIVIIKAVTTSLKSNHLFYGIYLEDAIRTREYLEETLLYPLVERDRIQCNIDLLRTAIDLITIQINHERPSTIKIVLLQKIHAAYCILLFEFEECLFRKKKLQSIHAHIV